MASYGGGNKYEGGKTIPHTVYLITRSSNGITVHTTFKYADGDTSCDCTGWTRCKVAWAGDKRQCKHTRRIATMTKSLDETGGSSVPAAKVEAPPPPKPTRHVPALDYLTDDEE